MVVVLVMVVAAAVVVVVVVVMVVVNELEKNLSSDFRYCLLTPEAVETCRHNST